MAKRQRRILVFGGTGFIGERLLKELRRRGAPNISIVHSQPLKHIAPSETVYYRIDPAASADEILDLARTHDTLVILTPPGARVAHSIGAALKTLGPRRVVYASSSLLYRGGEGAQDERAPLDLVTEYERGKRSEEELLEDAARRSASKLSIARLGSVYGSPSSRGIVSAALHALHQGKPLTIRHGGEHVRDYIHVDEVARALAWLALDDKAADIGIINISSGTGTSVAELLAMIESVTKRKLSRITEEGSRETERVVADNALLAGLFGPPVLDLRRGLKKTAAEFDAWYDARDHEK